MQSVSSTLKSLLSNGLFISVGVVEWSTPSGGSRAGRMKNERIVQFIGLYYQLNYLWSAMVCIGLHWSVHSEPIFRAFPKSTKKLNQNKAVKRRRNLYTKVAANGSRAQSLPMPIPMPLPKPFPLPSPPSVHSLGSPMTTDESVLRCGEAPEKHFGRILCRFNILCINTRSELKIESHNDPKRQYQCHISAVPLPVPVLEQCWCQCSAKPMPCLSVCLSVVVCLCAEALQPNTQYYTSLVAHTPQPYLSIDRLMYWKEKLEALEALGSQCNAIMHFSRYHCVLFACSQSPTHALHSQHSRSPLYLSLNTKHSVINFIDQIDWFSNVNSARNGTDRLNTYTAQHSTALSTAKTALDCASAALHWATRVFNFLTITRIMPNNKNAGIEWNRCDRVEWWALVSHCTTYCTACAVLFCALHCSDTDFERTPIAIRLFYSTINALKLSQFSIDISSKSEYIIGDHYLNAFLFHFNILFEKLK